MKRADASYRDHVARCLMGAALLANLHGLAVAAEFSAVIQLSELGGATGFRLNGVADKDRSGSAIANAGDVNGDGLDDLVIGSIETDHNGTYSGSSYVVFGKTGGPSTGLNLSALNGANGFRVDGEGADDELGRSVSAAGDVNGDGYGDLIIGAFEGNSPTPETGSTYVVFGKAKGFASILQLSALDGLNGFRINDASEGDNNGFSVAAAGDIDGDGFGDVIVGADHVSPGVLLAGSSYVVYGKPQSFQPVFELSALDGSNGFSLDGVALNDFSGNAVASAGDFNGDGLADMIVGALAADPHGNNSGSSYVVFGTALGFAVDFRLSALDGGNGFRIDGVASDDYSGYTLGPAGDFNGDGFDDVIIGAFGADPHGPRSGSSYLVFGAAGGFADVFKLSAINASTGIRFNGVASSDFSGRSVSGAGDVNGDGFADVIIGATFANPNGAISGSSYVVFGTAQGFNSAVELSALDGTTGFRLDGGATGDRSGDSVSGGGDVNGDGFDDVIVAAYSADANGAAAGTEQGVSYVMFGRAPDAAVSRIGSAASQYISGGAFADNLSGADGDDILEGRGGGDSMIGGIGSDTASYAHAPGATKASLAAPSGNSGQAKDDSYTEIENLEGSAFNDILTGDALANRLTGGKGKDALKGGKGRDTFVYRLAAESRPSSRDVIVGFNPGSASSAVDTIDLSAMDAKAKNNGNQAFTFRGSKAFSGAGQVRLKLSPAGVVIQGSTDDDKAAEFEILLKGLASTARITAKDFKL